MKKIIVFIATLSLISCNSDETQIVVSTSDFTIAIDENPNVGQILGTIEGTTNEGDVQFQIEEQLPEGAFAIHQSTGELTVAEAMLFDYELNSVLAGVVKVYNGDAVALASIEIALKDLDDILTTVEAVDFEIRINENPFDNEVLGTIVGTTNQGDVQFQIEEQLPEGAFAINQSTGELTVADAMLFDYEVNPILTGTIKVYNGEVSVLAMIKVLLNDLEEVVVTVEATDFEISINEDPHNEQILGVLQASTNQGELTFSIQEQYPENALDIDELSGEIKVKDGGFFNYESYPVITGIVNVTNGDVSASASVIINLLDVTYQQNKFRGTKSTISNGNFNIDIANKNINIIYENNEFYYLIWYLNQYNGNMVFNETSNILITNYGELTLFHGWGCQGTYSFTYDSSDRITNIIVNVTVCGPQTLNYNIEYIGNTVNFIDQINSNHKSIVLNDNNQILSCTSGSTVTDFIYDSNNNLISIYSGNSSITYEYDNFKNPFKFNETLNLSLVVDFINVLQNNFLSSNQSNNIYKNTNNITRVVRSNGFDNIDANYNYTYNSNSYPISKTVNVWDGSVEYFYYD